MTYLSQTCHRSDSALLISFNINDLLVTLSVTFWAKSVTFWYFIGLIDELHFICRFNVDIRKCVEVRLAIGCSVTLQLDDK